MYVKCLTAQKMKLSIKYFFSICDQIRRKLRIWSQLLKKCLMENFIFCAVSLFVCVISTPSTSRKPHYLSDLSNFDALLYKTNNKVPLSRLINTYRSIILSKMTSNVVRSPIQSKKQGNKGTWVGWTKFESEG